MTLRGEVVDMEIIDVKGLRVYFKKGKDYLNVVSGVDIKIKEILKPELDAQLVAESIADQLSKRAYFRLVMKKAVDTCMEAGAKGVKVICSGRLGGAEMARVETISQGKIPLQTLRADIDYGFVEAPTTYGNIGVKVWIYKGDIVTEEEMIHGLNAQAS